MKYEEEFSQRLLVSGSVSVLPVYLFTLTGCLPKRGEAPERAATQTVCLKRKSAAPVWGHEAVSQSEILYMHIKHECE